MVPLEQRLTELEQRLEKTDNRLKIALEAINALLGKQAEIEPKAYEPQKPPFNLSHELNDRGIKHTPEDISRLIPILKPYTTEQIGFTLTKVAAQAKKTTINNLVGYIKRSLEIEYKERV